MAVRPGSLAAISLFGLALGVAWSLAGLGECDRADCGWLQELLFSWVVLGIGLVLVSLCGLIGASIMAVVHRRQQPGEAAPIGRPRERSPAWAPALAAASVCLLAFLVLAVVGGVGGWWPFAVSAGVGLLVGALSRLRVNP